MSTFPTAFWKTQAVAPAETSPLSPLSISWVTGLGWSHENDWVSEYEVNDPEFTVKDFSSFPFWKQDPYGTFAPYYTTYNGSVGPEGSPVWPFSEPYCGWFLTGGYEVPYESYVLNDLTNLADRMTVAQKPNGWTETRRASPYEIGTDGTGLNIYYETDLTTVEELQPETLVSQLQSKYNNFIQSGACTGTFSLGLAATLYIKMSGLGEDNSNFGYMEQHDEVAVLIDGTPKISGHAPKDGREEYFGDLNVYMNQMKFFNWGSSTVKNPGNGFCKQEYGNRSPLPDYTTQATCEANAGEWVTANDIDEVVGVKAAGANRVVPHTTTAGQWTYSQSLATGSHTITIKFSTNDGLYHSGAYVGFDFWTG